ncbi:hypothetical protein ACFWVC_36255 [Streptomyces sp. NPDC058691]|uniref:hypothetical protein n=1 Tax=Streptomyces sp. NPDC058691 TaxID=3346601 RepID=UPI00364827C4
MSATTALRLGPSGTASRTWPVRPATSADGPDEFDAADRDPVQATAQAQRLDGHGLSGRPQTGVTEPGGATPMPTAPESGSGSGSSGSGSGKDNGAR